MSRFSQLLQDLWLTFFAFVFVVAVFLLASQPGSPDDALLGHGETVKELRAAIAMCGGENAVATLVETGLYQCATKRGHLTARVSP